MKRILPVALILLFGAVGFAATRLAAPPVPPPEVIIAEQRAAEAARELLDMRYKASALLYNQALDHLPLDQFHKRLYARSLTHLGYWEEAAENLMIASADTTLRAAIDRDLERLRGLSAGPARLDEAAGRWKNLRVNFSTSAGVGAVAILDNGIIVTTQPSDGSISFWSSSGALERTVRGLGSPVGVIADGDDAVVADMSGNRIIRVGRDGIRSVVALEGINGARSIDVDDAGLMWVADYGGGRAVRISPDGSFVTQAGSEVIDGPSALLTIGDDLLVAESGEDRVLRLDRNGRRLRYYSHKDLRAPVGLARIDGGFLVQGENGMVFWGRDRSGADEPSLVGPLPDEDGILVTSRFGLAADREGNIWWGNGQSLRMARRIPADLPGHLVEILKTEAVQGGNIFRVWRTLIVTAAVLSKDGKAIETLGENDFRLIRENIRLLPIRVENLSKTLSGRRLTIVTESSDALLMHKEPLSRSLEYLLETLRAGDEVSVVDVTDTWSLARDFTVSPELIRRAAFDIRPRVATIDVRPFAGLDYAIRVLAPTDYARGVLWITTGLGLDERERAIIERMGIANQVPIFILHVGGENRGAMERLAQKTNGAYFQLYGSPSPSTLGESMAGLRSGRYRIIASMEPPPADRRGLWTDVTLETYHLTEATFDKFGFYSF